MTEPVLRRPALAELRIVRCDTARREHPEFRVSGPIAVRIGVEDGRVGTDRASAGVVEHRAADRHAPVVAQVDGSLRMPDRRLEFVEADTNERLLTTRVDRG